MANYASQYTFGVSADTKSAQSSLSALNRSLRDLQKKPLTLSVQDASIKRAAESARTLEQALISATNVDTGKLDLNKFSASLQTANTDLAKLSQSLLSAGSQGEQAFRQLVGTISAAEAPVRRLNSAFTQMGVTLMNTIKWQASSSLIHGLMSSVSQAISYVRNLNSTLTDIRVVTGASSDAMARFAEQANAAAKRLSTTTNEFAKASLIFYQQGDSAELAAKKAEITTKAANIAFTASAQEMSQMLTAVWNSFQMGEDQLEHAVDVMAKLGANTASSMEEMAKAMQKVAATANTVGISMDQMSAIVATAASVTRQAPETIGTAWNTVLGRISNLKLGETLEDGVDLTKYTKALQSIGVSVLDANGELREMGTVVDEIGEKWQTLTSAQKSALAATIGGVRQYTQINAFFENFDKYQKNMKQYTGSAASGELNKQQEIWAQSWEAASKRAKAALETLYSQLLDDKAVVTITNFFTLIMNGITSITSAFGGMGNVLALIATHIAQTHLDTFATRLTEIGHSIKQVFSGSEEINTYADNLQKVITTMQGMTDREDISASTKVELEYNIQILKIKQDLAVQGNKLTQAQKEQSQIIIQQLESQRDLYVEIAKEREAASRSIADRKINDITDKAKERMATDILFDKDKNAYKAVGYQNQQDAKRLVNHDAQSLLQDATGAAKQIQIGDQMKNATDAAYELGKALGTIKDSSEELTLDKMVQSLKAAVEEESKVNSMMDELNSKFTATNEQTGETTFSLSNALVGDTSEADIQAYLTNIATSMQSSLSPVLQQVGDEVKLALSGENVDTATLETALTKIKTAFEEVGGEAGTAATNVQTAGKLLVASGFTQEEVTAMMQALREYRQEVKKVPGEADASLSQLKATYEKNMQGATNAVKSMVKVGMTLTRVVSAVNAMSNAMDKLKDPNASAWEKFSTVVGAFLTISMALSSVLALVNKETAVGIALKIKDAYSSAIQAAGHWTVTAALHGVAAGFKAAAAGASTFFAALGPIGWIILAITAIVAAIAALTAYFDGQEAKWQQEMAEKQKELAESMNEVSEATDKLQTDLQNLSTVMKDTSSSYDEQLKKINEICSAYGVQATMLDVLSGNYSGLAQAMRTASEAEISGQLEQAKKNENEASKLARQRNAHSSVFEHGSEGGVLGIGSHLTMQGVTYKSGQGIGEGTFNNQYEAEAIKKHTAELEKMGFKVMSNGEIKSTYKADYVALLDYLEANNDLLQYAEKQNTYLGGIMDRIYANGYGDVRTAKKQVHKLELQSNLIHNKDFDMFGLNKEAPTVDEVYDLLASSGAESAEDRTVLLDYLSGIENYKDVVPQLQALNSLSEQAATIQIRLNPDIEISREELETQIWEDLKDSGLDVDTLVYIHASDVEWDEENKKYVVNEAAQKVAEDQAKVAKAREKQSTLTSNKDLMTGDSFTKEDYDTLWATGLFETAEDLTAFMKSGAASRAAVWQQLYDEAIEAESAGLDAAIEDAKSRAPELEQAVQDWYDGLNEKALQLNFLNSNDIKIRNGQETYSYLAQERWNRQQTQEEKQAIIDEYQAIINDPNASDETKNAFAKKYLKKDKWNDSEVSTYMGGVTSDLTTATREWEELNDILQEGDSLIASMSANQQLLTNSMNEKEALEFYTKWLADVEKATNASTSFSEAIGKSGSMSAEALAELAKYDSQVVQLYNTMSSSEWNKYAYTKALEYYDSLLELYDEDSAEYAAALQAKKTASQVYYDTVLAAGKAMVDAQINEWTKIQNAASEAISSIKNMLTDVSKMDFVSIAKLKQNLLDAGFAMEDIIKLIQTLEDPNATDTDKIVESAVAQGNAALAQLTTLYKERQMYEKLQSGDIQHTTVVIDNYFVNGKASDKPVEGTYNITLGAECSWLPGSNLSEEFVDSLLTASANDENTMNFLVKANDIGVKLTNLTAEQILELSKLDKKTQHKVVNGIAVLQDSIEFGTITDWDTFMWLAELGDQKDPINIVNAAAKFNGTDFNITELQLSTLQWIAELKPEDLDKTLTYMINAGVEGFGNLEEIINAYLDEQEFDSDAERQIEYGRLMTYAVMNFDSNTIDKLDLEQFKNIAIESEDFTIDINYQFTLKDGTTGIETIVGEAEAKVEEHGTVIIPVDVELGDELKKLLGLTDQSQLFASNTDILEWIESMSSMGRLTAPADYTAGSAYEVARNGGFDNDWVVGRDERPMFRRGMKLLNQYLTGEMDLETANGLSWNNDEDSLGFQFARRYVDEIINAVHSGEFTGEAADALAQVLDVDLTQGVDSIKQQLKENGVYEVGKYIMMGIAAGITNEGETVTQALERLGLGNSVLATLCQVFDIRSPSHLTQYIGEMIIKGINQGMENTPIDFSKIEEHVSQAFKHLKELTQKNIDELSETDQQLAKSFTKKFGFTEGEQIDVSDDERTKVGDYWRRQRAHEIVQDKLQQSTNPEDTEATYRAEAEAQAAAEWEAMSTETQKSLVLADRFMKEYFSTDSEFSYMNDDSLDPAEKAITSTIIAAAKKAAEDNGQNWDELTGTAQAAHIQSAMTKEMDTVTEKINSTWQSLKSTWESTLTSLYNAEKTKAQEILDLWVSTFETIGKARLAAIKGDTLIETFYKSEKDMTTLIHQMVQAGITDIEEMWNLLTSNDYANDPRLQSVLSLNNYNMSDWVSKRSAVGNSAFLNWGPNGLLPTTYAQYQQNANTSLSGQLLASGGNYEEVITRTLSGQLSRYDTLVAKRNAGKLEDGDLEELNAIEALLSSLANDGLLIRDGDQFSIAEQDWTNSTVMQEIWKKFVDTVIGDESTFQTLWEKEAAAMFMQRETLAQQFESEQQTQITSITDKQAIVKKALEQGAENLERSEQDELLEIMEETDISALTGSEGIKKLQNKNVELGQSADAASKKVSALAEAIRQGFTIKQEDDGSWTATYSTRANAEATTRAMFNDSNVDLLHRPQVDASKLTAVGWEDAGEGTATVFTSTYKLTDFNTPGFEGSEYAINCTPILPNGQVLSPGELDSYVAGIFERANGDVSQLMELDKVENGGKGLFIGTYENLDLACERAERLHELQEEIYLEDEEEILTGDEITERFGGETTTHYEADAREVNTSTQQERQTAWLQETDTDLSKLDALQQEVANGGENLSSKWKDFIETIDMSDPVIAAAVEDLRLAVDAGEDVGEAWDRMTDAILQHGDVLLEDTELLRAYLDYWYEQYEITDSTGQVLNAASLNLIRYGKASKTMVSALTKSNKALNIEVGTMASLRKEAKKTNKSMAELTEGVEDLTDEERKMVKEFDEGYDAMDRISEAAGDAKDAFSNFDEELLDAAVNCETVEQATDLFADNFIQSMDNLSSLDFTNAAAQNFFSNADNFKNQAIAKLQEMGYEIPENMNIVWEAIDAAGGNLAAVDWGTVANTMGVDLSWILECLQAIINEYQIINGLEEFDLSAVIAEMQSAYNSASNLQSKYGGGGGGGSVNNNSNSGGSGGGGGGSAKKVQSYKKGADEKERYHEITERLDQQAKALEKIDKIKSRTFGANHLKALNDEIAALEKENELYAEQEKQAAVNMEANKKILEGYGATFNDDGTINYEEYMDKILADYNKAVDEYNNSDQGAGAELALQKAEEIYNEAKQAMEDYEEDMDKLNEAQENMLENQNKISAAMLEGIQYKVEVQWDFNDRDVKYLQYLRDKWEDTLDKADESMQAMIDEAAKYEDNLKSLQQEQDELNAAFAAGTLNEADYATGLQDVNDRSIEMLDNLVTIKKSIKEAYGNALQIASEELEKHTSILEHSHSVMEQYIELQQLMGLGADYSGLKKMYDLQVEASNQSVAAAKAYLDTLKASRARIEEQIAEHGWTDTLKEQWDEVNAAIIEGEDDLLTKTNQALTDAQNKFINTMNAIIDSFDETLFGMKGGLAKLEDDYAYYQEEQSRYLSTSKELYEVAKLSRQIDQSIADSTTKTSKERLKALKAEIEAQSEKTRLTEYDVQMMELQYKHALALQELEEAKNAKSVVRLTRDENGNFGYQYTADDQNISDAAQKVDDTLQQINELAAERVSEIEQAAVQAERGYRDALLEIAQDTTLTLEERQAKMEELTRRYAETMQYNQEQYNNATSALLINQQYVYERYGTSIMTNTGMVQDQMSNAVAAMMAKTTDYATFLQEQMAEGGAIHDALEQYKSDIELVNTTSGLGGWTGMTATVDTFREANEAANEAIKETIDTMSETMANISDVTEVWEDHANVLEKVIADYEKLATDSADALRKLGGNIAGTSVGASEGAAGTNPAADAEQWMYIWGAGGFSGTWSGYDSESAAKKAAKADIRQKIMSTLQAGETDAETAANKAKLEAIVAQADGTIQIEKYKHGGLIDYTGPAWVDGSLSDPELMLNSTDTRNLLKAVNFIREIDMETLEGLYEAINESTLGMMYNMGNIQAAYGLAGAEELQQNVSITAEFPNATDRNEIAGAFEDIINLAAQYASRKK